MLLCTEIDQFRQLIPCFKDQPDVCWPTYSEGRMLCQRLVYIKPFLKMGMKNGIHLFACKEHGNDPFYRQRRGPSLSYHFSDCLSMAGVFRLFNRETKACHSQ